MQTWTHWYTRRFPPGSPGTGPSPRSPTRPVTEPHRRTSSSRRSGPLLHVALEDRGFGQAGQALADAAGAGLADTPDGLEVVDAGGQQLLQAAEVFDQPVDDQAGQPR